MREGKYGNMRREDATDTVLVKSYIEKAMHGDEKAFTWLYQNYSKKVYFFAIRFFKQESIAEDIVQEVFFQVYKKIHTLQSADAFNSWLYTITNRICINHKRVKIELIQFENERDEDLLMDNKNDSVRNYLENQRIRTVVMETLDEMELSLQAIGQLKFLEDMKIVEIAKILNIPRTTVSRRIKIIQKRLQRNLEKNGITQASYGYVLVTPVILQDAYQVLFNTHTISEATSNLILDNVLSGTIKEVGKKSLSYVTKYIIGITLIVSMSFIFWLGNRKEANEATFNSNLVEQPIVVEPAKIVSINHSTEWQYTAITLDVETTNGHYDTITVNDIENMKISTNGTYTIKLLKNGNVIDQQDITISNIDLKCPRTTTTKDSANYYFYISDDVSGINWDSIQYHKNGVNSYAYTYNKNESVIVITNDGVSKHELFISDYAGNVLEISIT
jgi:RNA polymerase sigma-70 factor (ECF subfamily)